MAIFICRVALTSPRWSTRPSLWFGELFWQECVVGISMMYQGVPEQVALLLLLHLRMGSLRMGKGFAEPVLEACVTTQCFLPSFCSAVSPFALIRLQLSHSQTYHRVQSGFKN